MRNLTGKATDKQKAYLNKLGIKAKNLSKQEASDIISKYHGKNLYKCKKCNTIVIEENNNITCCGTTESTTTRYRTGRSLEQIIEEMDTGRRSSSMGSGMISSSYGVTDYVDDGNGNEWNSWEDYDDEN